MTDIAKYVRAPSPRTLSKWVCQKPRIPGGGRIAGKQAPPQLMNSPVFTRHNSNTYYVQIIAQLSCLLVLNRTSTVELGLSVAGIFLVIIIFFLGNRMYQYLHVYQLLYYNWETVSLLFEFECTTEHCLSEYARTYWYVHTQTHSS